MTRIPDRTPLISAARFAPGDVVRHRLLGFRGVVFDVDPVFSNTEEWWESIPEGMRPDRDQPFYHLFAVGEEENYIAYASQANLEPDGASGPVDHPAVPQLFAPYAQGRYALRPQLRH